MNVPCYWIEPTDDAFVEFHDGRPPEIHPAGAERTVKDWSSWGPRYRRADTSEVRNRLRDFGPDAMWDADWMHEFAGGHLLGGPNTDGRILCVRLPNGHDWTIDARCRNCTLPDDDTHRCWVRHGEPPNITVDKNGHTCSAGAGSIQSGDYHGFLRDGVLTP